MSDGLILDFDDIEKVIDGNNDVFEGTPLYGKNFKFFVKPVDGDTFESVRRKYTKIKGGGREQVDNREIDKELFMRQVINWEGISNKTGEEIPCTLENKKLLLKDMFRIASMINLACINLQIEGKLLKEDELKN